jgi:hypothetical protein
MAKDENILVISNTTWPVREPNSQL